MPGGECAGLTEKGTVAELCWKGRGGEGDFRLKRHEIDELEGNPKKVTLLYVGGQVPSDGPLLLCGRQSKEQAGSQQHHTVNLTSRPGGPPTLLFQPTKATKSPEPKPLFIGRELSIVP